MPTLLTTRKMSPELVARIESRVTGRRVVVGRRLKPVAVSALRFTALVVVVSVVVMFVLARRQDRANLAAERAALLERAASAAAALSEEDLRTRARAESWLLRLSGPYEGDFVAEELEKPGALGRVLARPAIYVRGDVIGFTNPAAIRATAAESRKDPFLLCLIEPPAERSERAQLKKVHAAYAGKARVEQPTAHVRRLEEAMLGATFLTAGFRADVRAAESHAELARLKRAFDAAPIEASQRAAKARLLVIAMDEPGDDKGPTELDGERRHPVRVAIVDFDRDQVLLRLRKTVDPKWISAARRADYARGLDSCALALDVRDAVSPPAQ